MDAPARPHPSALTGRLRTAAPVCAACLSLAATMPMASFDATAQARLREPTRTVYRCETAGKVIYSDEPCLGARRIDVEPTRGFDASNGRIGTDVRRERHNEQMAEALKPLLGETPRLRELRLRRSRLTPQARSECTTLDGSLVDQEAAERQAAGPTRAEAQAELLRLRQRHRSLGC